MELIILSVTGTVVLLLAELNDLLNPDVRPAAKSSR